MSKIEKVGGTLVVSAGLFFGLTYLISGSDVQQPLAGESAVGGGSGVNSSKSSDSLGMGQIESTDGASMGRRVSEFSGGAFEDFQTQPSAAGEQIHIGSFIDPDDADALAQEIERYAAMPETERTQIGNRAAHWIKENRSFDKLGKELSSIIETISS